MVVAFIAGLLSGALGLGGGTIYGPLLLELGLHPTVAFSTSMYMILFSSLTNSTLFGLAGLLKYDYGLVLGLSNIFGALTGLTLINRYIEKTGRASIIVFILAFIMLGSAIVITIYSTIKIVENIRKGINVLAFEWVC